MCFQLRGLKRYRLRWTSPFNIFISLNYLFKYIVNARAIIFHPIRTQNVCINVGENGKL